MLITKYDRGIYIEPLMKKTFLNHPPPEASYYETPLFRNHWQVFSSYKFLW